MEEKAPVYIGCLRFGSKRFAMACAHYDRFRGCRKRCKSLEEAMKADPDFIQHVEEAYRDRQMLLPCRHSCKGLPLEEDNPYKCTKCGYVAKSIRGMKSHATRSHPETSG